MYSIAMGLKDRLKGRLPSDLLPCVSDHYEIIGDIAILALPAEVEPFRQAIVESVLSRHRKIITVLNKCGNVSGERRTARYETWYGGTTETVCREFGFSYRIDVSRSFFSTRMAYERKRVTDQVKPEEQVYVPFVGVGPFAIPAAARGAEVYAVEKNPDAFRYLAENVAINGVSETCRIRLGDARDTTSLPHDQFDRIIIPAPYGMDGVPELFLPLLACGGTAHFYTFRTKEEIPALLAAFEESGLAVAFNARCGNVAPKVSRWVFDLARPVRS